MADRLDARSTGHPQIEHEHMRGMSVHMTHDGREIARLGDDVDACLAVQQQPQAAAHRNMVVGQQDRDRKLSSIRVLVA